MGGGVGNCATGARPRWRWGSLCLLLLLGVPAWGDELPARKSSRTSLPAIPASSISRISGSNLDRLSLPSFQGPNSAAVRPAKQLRPLPAQDAPPQNNVELQVLDGRQIACRTAETWIPSEVLRARARTVIELYQEEDECTRQAARALANFLCMQAEHQEDIGAASALRAYYGRIAVAEQLLLTQESLALIDEELEKQRSLQSRGIAAGTDLSEFERRRLELQDQQLQLHSQDRQLRSVLRQIAHLDYSLESVLPEPLEVCECPLDCEAIKQAAMGLRYDLRSWSYLAGQVNETSAPVFAQMLSTLVGGWGLPIPPITGLKMLLCPPDYSRLSANMRHEIRLAVETHRGWISQAVDEKCAKTIVAYQRIDLARQMVASWEARIEQLDRLEELGNGQPEQRALARASLLKARSEEISRRLEARQAEIDLAEATGGLSDRCCAGQPWLLTGYSK